MIHVRHVSLTDKHPQVKLILGNKESLVTMLGGKKTVTFG